MKSHLLLAIVLAVAWFLGSAGTVRGQVPNPYLPDPTSVDPGIYVPQAPAIVYSPIIYPPTTVYTYTPYVTTYSPLYYSYSPVVGPVYPYPLYGYYNSPFMYRSAFVYHTPHVVHYGPQVIHHAPAHVTHH
jgi:hypothetical protein